jgi:HAE1 family hydrophobic/amphiphilic exporter-1
MTTVMLMAGMVPIALGVGPGTASRASIAKVIIGGQLLSLLLSLLVTPVAYSYFAQLGEWRARRRAARAPSAPTSPAAEPTIPAGSAAVAAQS